MFQKGDSILSTGLCNIRSIYMYSQTLGKGGGGGGGLEGGQGLFRLGAFAAA